MIYKRVKFNYIYVVIALVLLMLSVMGGRYIPSAFADTQQYTSALTDLQKDSSFNTADYPDKADDYAIRFIQIAESADKELFVYTYQPSQKTTYLVATEINMALSESVDGTQLYALTLLNSDGVFCKYKVNDVTVSSDIVRYYNISSIYREWQKGIDEETDNDNTKNAVAFEVGKLYTVTNSANGLLYFCKNIDVVTVINPFVDFLEYRNGFYLHGWAFDPQWCDSHYIAFSTDKQIDYLVEADITYIKRDCSRGQGLGGCTIYGDLVKDYITLNGEQIGDNWGDGFLSKKYEWKRIQTVEEFIKTEDLTETTKSSIYGLQWVLRFKETRRAIKEDILSTHSTLYWSEISNVSILRLKFVTDGKVYNLGVVSDKVTGDNISGNNNTNEIAGLFEWLERVTGVPQWVLKLLAAIIPLAILLPILSAIFPVVGQVLALVFGALLKAFIWLFKGLLWLVCLPFKGIAALVRKIKDKKDGG